MSTIAHPASHQAIERLGWTLIHFVWQAAAIALLLAVALHLLREVSSKVRYAISCLALALIVALPIATIQFIEVSGPLAEVAPLPAHPAFPAVAPVPIVEAAEQSPAPVDALPPATTDRSGRVPWRERLARTLEPALPYLVLGWLVGVFGLSLRHLGGWAQLHRLKQQMVREVAAPLQAKLGQLAGRLGIQRAMTLLESALVEVPTVVGWIKPVVLLPASALTGLNAEQLEAILAHELAHVKRYDYLVNILQTVVDILGFYHPALWWVSHRIREERENCCDDLAVHICGDSLRYAKALTHLEEMRHRGVELAVAATGGSLVGRIGRLIGLPTPAKTRFAWLPGLVALLLVATVVVPGALVLAAPAPRSTALTADEPLAEDSGASRDVTDDVIMMSDVPRTQVLLSFRIIDIDADRVLDPETAATVQGLLTRLPAGAAGRPAASATVPTLAELREPLGDVFARFAPIQDESKQLADLLVARDYARIVSGPKILTSEDEPASISVGEMGDPNVPTGRGMKMTVTAHVLHERSATRLTIDYLDRRPIGNLDDPNAPTSVSQIASTIVVAHEQYAALVAGSTEDSSRSARLLLVSPQVHYYPLAPDASADGRDTVPPGLYRGRRSRSDATEADEPNATQVHVTFVIAKALTGATLDQQTRLSLAAVLAEQDPHADDDIAAPARAVTLGEVLRKYAAQKLLPAATADALVKTLVSRGYVKVQAKPIVMVTDNREAQIKTASEDYYEPAVEPGSPPQRIELGLSLRVTPHVPDPPADRVRLDIGLEHTERTPPGVEPPGVRSTEIASTVTALDGHYFSLLVQPDNGDGTVPQDPESTLVMVKPRIITPDTAALGEADTISPALSARVSRYADARVRALREDIARLEVDLVQARLTKMERHPEIVRLKSHIEALQERSDKILRELERDFDNGSAENGGRPLSR